MVKIVQNIFVNIRYKFWKNVTKIVMWYVTGTVSAKCNTKCYEKWRQMLRKCDGNRYIKYNAKSDKAANETQDVTQ